MVDSFLDFPKGFVLFAGDDVEAARAYCQENDLSPEDFKINKMDDFFIVKRK